jgi:HEXXH motif-containing protein
MPSSPHSPSTLGSGLVLPPPSAGPGVARPLGAAFANYLGFTSRAFFQIGHRLPPPLREPYRRVAAAVQRATGKNARAMLGCFASPTVGTAIQTAMLRETLPDFAERIDAALSLTPPHLLLEMALRRLLPDDGEPLDWPVPSGVEGPVALSSLPLGVTLEMPAATTVLRFLPGELRALAGDTVLDALALHPDAVTARAAEAADGARISVRVTYRPVGKVTRFAIVNHNPIAEFEAHPDKAGNAIDLGGRPVEEWLQVLDEAFAILAGHAPDLLAEMEMMLHEVIPVGYDEHRHLSASYREAIGTVYLTLHPNRMTMVEALIHEFQHNKMNVASYSMDVLENPFHPRYPSPVRPDPRPLWGILLAVHAFLPVAVLYRRMREADHPNSRRPDFERRLAEIDLKNHEGMEMLRQHARWTATGRTLMAELDALDRAHMSERSARGLSTTPDSVHLG